MDDLPSNVTVEANEDEGYAQIVVNVPAPGPFSYRVRPARTGGGFVISDPLNGKLLTANTFEQACETATSLAVALSERGGRSGRRLTVTARRGAGHKSWLGTRVSVRVTPG